ncbi:MAG TPA: SAV_6107 family HEPN domain-containing protein [Mycobacteriales bacterium]
MPASALPRRTPAALLGSARAGVLEALASPEPADRYVRAHLAALRAAAAVLAARARPAPAGGRRRAPTVWTLLPAVAPELGEWAAFFAAGAAKRAAAESGLVHAVTAREADDLVRDAQSFLELVESGLGLDPGLFRADGTAAGSSAVDPAAAPSAG